MRERILTVLGTTASFRYCVVSLGLPHLARQAGLTSPSDILGRNLDRASLALIICKHSPSHHLHFQTIPGTHVDAVLAVNHKLLPITVRIRALRILILIYRRRARIAQQPRILRHVGMCVPGLGARFLRKTEVRGLAFGVVCTRPSDRGEDVE